MGNALSFDSRGRLTLPKHLREALGETVIAIRTPHGVVLHPVPRRIRMGAPAAGASGESLAMDETE